MTIKKQFQAIIALLEDNKNVKVSTILKQVYPLVESKKSETTYMNDNEGNPFAIYCWYHKQWELIGDTEFGAKKNTKTGLSNMCKIGTSKWTKAQRDATKANAQILVDVASGSLEPSAIIEKQAEIEITRTTVNNTDIPQGYTLEEITELLNTYNGEEIASH